MNASRSIASYSSIAALLAALGLAAGCGDTVGGRDVATDVATDVALGPADAPGVDAPGTDVVAADVPPVTCPADPASPNQDQASARVITARGTLDALVVCRGSDDWFRVDLDGTSALQFDVCRPSGAPAPTLQFFRAEFPDPRAYLGGGQSSSGETCDGTTLWEAPGSYFFHVSTTAARVDYRARTILLARQPESCPCDAARTCTGGVCVCRADALEPNNASAQAHALTLGQRYADLVSCVGDLDWYTVDVPAGMRLRIHAETAAILGAGYLLAVGVYARDNDRTPLAFFPKAEPAQDFVFAAPAAATYLLRVENPQSGGRTYALQVDAVP